MTTTVRGSLAAAVPLAIALLGGSIELDGKENVGGHYRLAAAAIHDPIRSETLSDNQKAWLSEHNPFGIPAADVQGNRTLIVRQGYTLAHNNVDLIADWVSFHLTKEYVSGSEKRPGTSAFQPDPKLPSYRRAELDDYKGWKGVFDRGHQVANKDSVGRGDQVVRESFFLSNMTPQSSRLNQTPWRMLEADIQELANERGELWVITGPLFVDDDNDGLVQHLTIGTNQVSVPTHYFKIVLAEVPGQSNVHEAMAFLIPNQNVESKFDNFLRSIDLIEEVSGLDFFPDMAENIQEQMETVAADKVWVK